MKKNSKYSYTDAYIREITVLMRIRTVSLHFWKHVFMLTAEKTWWEIFIPFTNENTKENGIIPQGIFLKLTKN